MALESAAFVWEVCVSGRFEDLEVWQFGMDLVYFVYDVTARFPKDELYGLVAQMRRAAVSVPSNIAEGKGRTSDKDFAAFLCHSRGSVYELQTQMLIAQHLGYFVCRRRDKTQGKVGQSRQDVKWLDLIHLKQAAADWCEVLSQEQLRFFHIPEARRPETSDQIASWLRGKSVGGRSKGRQNCAPHLWQRRERYPPPR